MTKYLEGNINVFIQKYTIKETLKSNLVFICYTVWNDKIVALEKTT